MKKILVISLGVLLFGAAAYAAQPPVEGPFRFECRYSDQTGKTGFGVCRADAIVRDYLILEEALNHPDRDLLQVECNGQVLYRDGAIHDVSESGKIQIIKAITHGQQPPIAIAYPSKEPRHHHFITTSWLRVDGVVLTGFCQVSAAGYSVD